MTPLPPVELTVPAPITVTFAGRRAVPPVEVARTPSPEALTALAASVWTPTLPLPSLLRPDAHRTGGRRGSVRAGAGVHGSIHRNHGICRSTPGFRPRPGCRRAWSSPPPRPPTASPRRRLRRSGRRRCRRRSSTSSCPAAVTFTFPDRSPSVVGVAPLKARMPSVSEPFVVMLPVAPLIDRDAGRCRSSGRPRRCRSSR